MKSLDTNIMLRLLLRDALSQLEKVFSLLDISKSGSLMVADAVFMECVWILSGKGYNFDREHIGELLLEVADLPQLSCNQVMLAQAIPIYIKYPSISFVDACLSAYAELNHATPLLTFDKKLVSSLPKTVKAL